MDLTWANMSLLLSGFFILAIMSWLWKGNIIYSIVEHLYVGTAIGHGIVMAIANIRSYAWLPLTKADYTVLIPIALGLLFYAQLTKNYRYLSRLAFAVVIGTSLGVAIGGLVEVQIINMTLDTAKLVIMGADSIARINNILLALFVVLGITVFFMTWEPEGKFKQPMNYIRRSGRLVLMAFFGSVLANNIMSRFASVAGIMSTLIDWLNTIIH